jgi:hypothetical protein
MKPRGGVGVGEKEGENRGRVRRVWLVLDTTAKGRLNHQPIKISAVRKITFIEAQNEWSWEI